MCISEFEPIPWAKFHFQIVPKDHYQSFNINDEDVQDDLKSIKKIANDYFKAQNLSVLFLEFANIEDTNSHACINVIPYEDEKSVELEMYFKKSIQDDISEWSNNKKLIDTGKWKGDITKCIP